MRSKFKISKLTIAAISLVALSLLYFFVIKPGYSNQNNLAVKPAQAVSVVTIKKEQVQKTQDLPARVAAFKISEIRPQIDGVVKKIKFVEGSFVKEGQQLYQIDPSIYQAAYDNTKAALKTLQAKMERYKQLIELDAVSKQEYDDVEAAFLQAQANAKTAKTNVEYTKVLAPISGYIGKSNITQGALVTAKQADVLTTITQLDPVYIDMAQPSKEAVALGNQSEIVVSLVDEESHYEETGTLKFSEVFADETTDSVRLRALFPNKNKKLLPGMFVTAKLHLKPIEAIIVPQRATNRGPDGGLSVFVVGADNVAKARIIKADEIYKDNWIVKEGLEEGELVVVEGFQKIGDGAPVSPTPFVATTSPTPAAAPKSEEKK